MITFLLLFVFVAAFNLGYFIGHHMARSHYAPPF